MLESGADIIDAQHITGTYANQDDHGLPHLTKNRKRVHADAPAHASGIFWWIACLLAYSPRFGGAFTLGCGPIRWWWVLLRVARRRYGPRPANGRTVHAKKRPLKRASNGREFWGLIQDSGRNFAAS